jgi:hypothetical protein
MIQKIAFFVFFIAITGIATAQTTEPAKKTGRPDIPGTFLIDLGLNRLTEKPNNLKYGLWGSRTVNLYYLYDMRIGKSKFSFHPGIGLGMERFKLQSFQPTGSTRTTPTPTLIYDAAGNTTFADAGHVIYDADTLGQINWSSSYSTKKSMLVMNYLDIPVEFRFSLKPEDPGRSFKIAVGGRVGYLLSANTKIKYKENGDLKKLKNQQDFNLSTIRYSAYMRIYLGNFNLFGYYNLNPLFKDKKGPAGTEAASYTVGISLVSF